VGDTTVAIHWDYAREVLQKADGVIATVGLEAELPTADPQPTADKTVNSPPSAGKTTDPQPPAGNTTNSPPTANKTADAQPPADK
jgi:hypothetical protein